MKAWEYLSSWTNFGLPSNIQKRLYQFLLRKAIGEFVQNDLNNFDIDLKNGHVELRRLELNLEVLPFYTFFFKKKREKKTVHTY
jgi:hypothetical protein